MHFLEHFMHVIDVMALYPCLDEVVICSEKQVILAHHLRHDT